MANHHGFVRMGLIVLPIDFHKVLLFVSNLGNIEGGNFFKICDPITKKYLLGHMIVLKTLKICYPSQIMYSWLDFFWGDPSLVFHLSRPILFEF